MFQQKYNRKRKSGSNPTRETRKWRKEWKPRERII
jgi:hypothetical protein